jgi:hypothetical protein
MLFKRIIFRLALSLTMIAAMSGTVVAQSAEETKELLKGKVQASDHVVRLQRPKTPVLQSASPSGAGSQPARLQAEIDFGDFALGRHRQMPEMPMEDRTAYGAPPTAPMPAPDLRSNAEDDELVIAWEEWHKRVCRAIYEAWMANSHIRGVAHTEITVTRDRHIYVTIKDVEVSPLEMARAPRHIVMAGKLEEEFVNEIMQTVQPLDGSGVLTFPERSRRERTSFSPYFKKQGESGYDWRTDDYERVRLN